MKIRCLIVDDEPLAIRLISSYAQQLQVLEIVAVCNNALEAFELLQKNKIDLIFLDIKMPKLLGTDFIKGLANPPKVIFITAYREYAIEGFELDVVDYLVKPVSLNRFMKAVAKATTLINASVENFNATSTAINIENTAFLYVKVDKKMVKIFLKNIEIIESQKEYVKIYFDDDKVLIAKQNISQMEMMLSPHDFIRIHRSFIISIKKVMSYTNSFVVIRQNNIPIGRLYKNEWEKVLQIVN